MNEDGYQCATVRAWMDSHSLVQHFGYRGGMPEIAAAKAASFHSLRTKMMRCAMVWLFRDWTIVLALRKREDQSPKEKS